ncbi:MAG TPA: FKBP-type peptidyl-prolyl cis-trans isomerase [Acidimicrobiia bacterium]
MRESVRVVLLVTLAAVAAVALPACGNDKKEEASKPKVEVPSGDPPKTLEKKDLKVGSGDEALAGQTVTVHYVGVSFSTKKQFDASWDGGDPFTFPLGAGRVIPGWDQGVPGMKVGGRRQLVIPPDLAYGAQGYPPDIAPNETLVFVVDLVSVS